jgi:hypothetical protein
MFFVLKFELILIIGSNNVLTEGAGKVYRRRQGAALDRAAGGKKGVTNTNGMEIALAYFRKVN